jgi:hypothetical protein
MPHKEKCVVFIAKLRRMRGPVGHVTRDLTESFAVLTAVHTLYLITACGRQQNY